MTPKYLIGLLCLKLRVGRQKLYEKHELIRTQCLGEYFGLNVVVCVKHVPETAEAELKINHTNQDGYFFSSTMSPETVIKRLFPFTETTLCFLSKL